MFVLFLLYILVSNVYYVLCKTPSNYDIPLNDIERQQNEILKNLTKEREATKKLQFEIDEINQKPKDPSRIGISVRNDSVEPEKVEQTAQESISSKHDYTPPVIILLPEDTSDRDIWEYTVSKHCLKGGFSAAYRGDDFTLVEMAEDSTATIDELHEHLQSVEKEIEKYISKSKDLRAEHQQLKLNTQPEQNNKKLLYNERKLERITKHLISLEKRKEKLKNRIKAIHLFSASSHSSSSSSSSSSISDHPDNEEEDSEHEDDSASDEDDESG